jgi:4-azaleucine resistance transporter AzlC
LFVFRTLVRDVAAICAAIFIVGLAFGALATAAGLSIWMAAALSMFVLAGGSQFMIVAGVAAGANPWTAVLSGLLINARHVPFGMAMAQVIGDRWREKLIGAHLLVDEVVAFARAQSDPRLMRIAYWLCGAGLFLTWNLGTLAGAFLGDAVPDPEKFGIDAAFPAALFALLLPSLRTSARTRRVALIGAAIGVATTPFLPAGVPVLTSLAGLFAAGRVQSEESN